MQMASSEFQVWLVTVDGDGEKVPYELVGGASSRELAQAIRDAAIEIGLDAVILCD